MKLVKICSITWIEVFHKLILSIFILTIFTFDVLGDFF